MSREIRLVVMKMRARTWPIEWRTASRNPSTARITLGMTHPVVEASTPKGGPHLRTLRRRGVDHQD